MWVNRWETSADCRSGVFKELRFEGLGGWVAAAVAVVAAVAVRRLSGVLSRVLSGVCQASVRVLWALLAVQAVFMAVQGADGGPQPQQADMTA